MSDEAAARWHGWQRAHQSALQALQDAEASYHRLVTDGAFLRDDEAARARKVEALARLDELRVRLDEIREQRPPWPY